MSQTQQTKINDAYIQFVKTLKDEKRADVTADLNRFVRYLNDTTFTTDLTPHGVAEYCEWLGNDGGGDVMKKLKPVKEFLTYLDKQKMTVAKLATHARAPKNRNRARAAKLQKQQEAAELTAEGKTKLERELHDIDVELKQVVKDIGRAMADKDFRENAPLHAAKDKQGMLEARKRDIRHTLDHSVIVGNGKRANNQRVAIGKRVTIKRAGSADKLSYLVVHPSEANPTEKRLSSESPVGKAVINRAKGDTVKVETPGGAISYTIEAIEENVA